MAQGKNALFMKSPRTSSRRTRSWSIRTATITAWTATLSASSSVQENAVTGRASLSPSSVMSTISL